MDLMLMLSERCRGLLNFVNEDDDDGDADDDEIYAKTTICHNNYNSKQEKPKKGKVIPTFLLDRQIGRQTDFNICRKNQTKSQSSLYCTPTIHHYDSFFFQ